MNAVSLQRLFGNKLKFHRKLCGMTQSQLSERSGVSLEYISKIERGLASPSFNIIGSLADALDILPVTFFQEGAPSCTLQLREINHRIKNNYQIIANLLSLAREDAGDEKDAASFEDVRLRVQSMAATHDLLADLQGDSCNLKEFIHRLYLRLKDVFGVKNMEAVFDVDELRLPPRTAFSLGLAVNEIFSNVLKHGLCGPLGGNVSIELKSVDGHARLTVKNPTGAASNDSERLLPKAGMSIIKSIVKEHLKGEFRFHSSNVAVAEILFPTP